MTEKKKLLLGMNRLTPLDVAERAERQTSKGAPLALGDLGTSIQFLRGVGSRATFALSSFYLLVASSVEGKNRCTIPGYAGSVLQSQIHFASQNTISLACRKAFDHGKGLTGAVFGRVSDATLERHAEHWAKVSNRPQEDAYRALHFLRTFFAKCSKKPDALFKDRTTLGCRIGLIKQHADRFAAHLSVDGYEFDTLDLAHLVAAITLIGSIICTFDRGGPPDYFNQIDEAALRAAIGLFPDAADVRLFQHVNIDMQASACWRLGEDVGMQMLMEQLPYAIGWA